MMAPQGQWVPETAAPRVRVSAAGARRWDEASLPALVPEQFLALGQQAALLVWAVASAQVVASVLEVVSALDVGWELALRSL